MIAWRWILQRFPAMPLKTTVPCKSWILCETGGMASPLYCHCIDAFVICIKHAAELHQILDQLARPARSNSTIIYWRMPLSDGRSGSYLSLHTLAVTITTRRELSFKFVWISTSPAVQLRECGAYSTEEMVKIVSLNAVQAYLCPRVLKKRPCRKRTLQRISKSSRCCFKSSAGL